MTNPPSTDGPDDELIDEADDLTEDDDQAEPEPSRPLSAAERRARRLARASGTTVSVDPSLRITDRVSSLFVIASIVFFVGVLANGILLGRGGLLVPSPTPTPVPSATATPNPSPSATASPATSPSASPSASPAASESPAPSAS